MLVEIKTVNKEEVTVVNQFWGCGRNLWKRALST